MRKIVLATLAASMLAVAPGRTQNNEISMQKALTVAQQGTSGLTLLFGRAETKGAAKNKVWGFYFITDDGWIWEKEISSMSGGLVFEKKIKDIENKGKVDPKVVEMLKTKVLTKLPNQRYIEIAQDKSGGQAGEFILYINGKTLVVQIKGDGANGWQVNMDMTTGRILN